MNSVGENCWGPYLPLSQVHRPVPSPVVQGPALAEELWRWRADFSHVLDLTAWVAVALTPTVCKGQFRQKKTDLHEVLKSTGNGNSVGKYKNSYYLNLSKR